MKLIVLKFVFAIVVFALPMLARADGECAQEVSQVLTSKGITDFRTPVVERISNPSDSSDLGYLLWFRLERCSKGYLVAQVLPSCRIVTLYTRGGCQVEGLSHWPY